MSALRLERNDFKNALAYKWYLKPQIKWGYLGGTWGLLLLRCDVREKGPAKRGWEEIAHEIEKSRQLLDHRMGNGHCIESTFYWPSLSELTWHRLWQKLDTRFHGVHQYIALGLPRSRGWRNYTVWLSTGGANTWPWR